MRMTLNNLKNVIAELLNVPVYDDGASITFPSVTVMILNNSPGVHGDGKGLSRVQSIRIDLWYMSEDDRNTAVQRLLSKLEALPGITSPDIISIFDTQARKYRATFDFEMI